MSIDNETDVNTITADATSTSDVETTNPTSVPVENRVAELNRKFTQLQRSLDDKFGQLISSLQTVAQPQQTRVADEAPIEGILKHNVNTMVDEKIMALKHAESYQEALQSYPELNPDSERFDDRFLKLADTYYASLRASGFADAPLKAVRMAAMDLGKYEQLERERILADEAKRMRTLGDGSVAAKQGQKEKQASYNQTLASLLKIDAKGMQEHMKKYGHKYGVKG